MSKRIYISADYAIPSGDREVVDVLHKWASDSIHTIDFVDTALVVSGSVSADPDCRICDLKKEFNAQINVSSVVLTQQELLDLIILSYKLSNNKIKLPNKLIIVCRKNDDFSLNNIGESL